VPLRGPACLCASRPGSEPPTPRFEEGRAPEGWREAGLKGPIPAGPWLAARLGIRRHCGARRGTRARSDGTRRHPHPAWAPAPDSCDRPPENVLAERVSKPDLGTRGGIERERAARRGFRRGTSKRRWPSTGSRQRVPGATPSTVSGKMPGLRQSAQVVLYRVAVGAGQRDGLGDADPAMLPAQVE